MCINAHDPKLTEEKAGRRVCTACVSQYTRRRRIHNPSTEKVPPNDQPQNR